MKYAEHEVEAVLGAYRALFPSIEGCLLSISTWPEGGGGPT